MNMLIEKGFARLSDKSDEEFHGKIWYIPDHGVYHPTKNKIRVVFDAAASFNGACLNHELISGPDLTSSLIGILIRFRDGLVPFTADIESMFHQMGVPLQHQSCLRFVWWRNGDLNAECQTYQMKVHIFGATSSPGCANFALRRTSLDHGTEFGSRTVDAVNENFYVDDLLCSEDTTEDALTADIEKLCAKGGFNLTKFLAPDSDVLKGIPEEKRVKRDGSGAIERALGVYWNLEKDIFIFRLTLKDTPLTRRGVLSAISSIFDPLGIAGPFVKKILQSITNERSDWDELLSDTQRMAWERWRKDISQLENVSIRRCYKQSASTVASTSLHCFFDASDIGYGNACYVRTIHEDGTIDVTLATGKSRVSPMKGSTMPRMELVAAISGVKCSVEGRAAKRTTKILLDR